MMGAINFEVDHKVKGKINGTHYANNMQWVTFGAYTHGGAVVFILYYIVLLLRLFLSVFVCSY